MSKPIFFDLRTRKQVESNNFKLEKELQITVENNMEQIFGIKFLATEYSFDDGEYAGRIDSLGLDNDYRPVVIEYKLSQNKNIINQSLHYINWLKNHKGDFELLVLDKLGLEYRKEIDWDAGPRAICIAEQFSKYDPGAIQQMNANIELYQYYLFGSNKELIGFEKMNQINETKKIDKQTQIVKFDNDRYEKEKYGYIYEILSEELKNIIEYIKEKIIGISEDISFSEVSRYAVFKRIRNFCYITLTKQKIKLYLQLNFKKEYEKYENVEDVTGKNHWGRGDVLINIIKIEDFEKVFDLVCLAYEKN